MEIPFEWKARMRQMPHGWWQCTGGGFTCSARLPWQAYYRWVRNAWPRVAARHRAYAERIGVNG